MSKKRQFRKPRRQSQQNQQGGTSAAEYVTGVVGGIGQQTAVTGSNIIAMKDLTTPPVVAQTTGGALVALTPATIENSTVTPVKGGAVLPLTPAQVNGGGVLQDVAVPAVLLMANSAFKGRKSMSKRLFKRRSSSRRRRSSNKRRR
jgi:hypothetical protein